MFVLPRYFAAALLALPLLNARTAGLSTDSSKYLAEAEKRITRISREIDADVADPAKAVAAKDDLLASKRFLDSVQKEEPANVKAVSLQSDADKLLEKLRPTLLKMEIARALDETDKVLASIESRLAATSRDARAEEALMDEFDGVRSKVKDVLAKEPANDRALKLREREEQAWKKFDEQRKAAAQKKGGKP